MIETPLKDKLITIQNELNSYFYYKFPYNDYVIKHENEYHKIHKIQLESTDLAWYIDSTDFKIIIKTPKYNGNLCLGCRVTIANSDIMYFPISHTMNNILSTLNLIKITPAIETLFLSKS